MSYVNVSLQLNTVRKCIFLDTFSTKTVLSWVLATMSKENNIRYMTSNLMWSWDPSLNVCLNQFENHVCAHKCNARYVFFHLRNYKMGWVDENTS